MSKAPKKQLQLALRHTANLVAVPLLGILAAIILTGLGAQTNSETWRLSDGVQVLSDIPFARPADNLLRLNIVLPPEDSAELRPVVVYIHGGAWRTGNRRSGMRYLLPLARAGYIGISIDYRLTQQARFPAQIHDVKAAVRWVRAHIADYGGDPQRIAIAGSSAGAQLALLLGLSGGEPALEGAVGNELDESSTVSAIVDWFGPSDLRYADEQLDSWEQLIMQELLGGLPTEVPELAALASPITHVDSADPPVLIIHGTADETVPVELSQKLYAALQAAGVEAEYVEIPEGGHGFFRYTEPDQDELNAMMIDFLDRHLKAGAT
jgi:acetyl esterase/lipase